MIRTTVFISETDLHALSRLADRRGTTRSEVIRTAIYHELAEFASMRDAMPVLHSGNPVFDDEAALTEAGFGHVDL